jgi:hypothetical protein
MYQVTGKSRRPTRDGVMVFGWLTRLTLALVVFAIFAFDGISIITAKVGAGDEAQSVALAAAEAYQSAHSGSAVLAAAKSALSEGDTLVPKSIKVASDGTVTLKIRRTAKSIVLHLWSTSARWDVVTATGSARPPS